MLPARLAALFGFLGVALGAFGAHALKTRLLASGTLDLWQTGVFYHLLHAACLLALAFAPAPTPPWLRRSTFAFAFGILVFSGTLYLMALGAPRWLGAITPIGGVSLLAGWSFILVWSFQRKASS